MKSMKTLIISGAVTLAMALPLSGIAAKDCIHGKHHGHHHGDHHVAQACIMQNVKTKTPSKRIVKAYCAANDSGCATMVTGIINEKRDTNFSAQMLAVIKGKNVSKACKAVAAACKKNNCLSDYAPSS